MEGEKEGKRGMTLLWGYIWLSYVGAPVWYVRSLPALHPAGSAATGEEQAADDVRGQM